MNLVPGKEKHARKGISLHFWVNKTQSRLTASHLPPRAPDSGQKSRERPPVWNGSMGLKKKKSKSRKFMQLKYLKCVCKQPCAEEEREPEPLTEGQV